jgi:nitrogen fixation protein FixH
MSRKKGTGWPVGIFTFYSLFVAGLLLAVFLTLNNDMQMVTSNYYEKTLKYEDQITRIRNANALEVKPDVAFNRDKSFLILNMPEISGARNFTGKIHFFRASNAKLDQSFTLQCDAQGRQYIPLSNIENGKWKIQIEWTDKTKEYYFEQIVIK